MNWQKIAKDSFQHIFSFAFILILFSSCSQKKESSASKKPLSQNLLDVDFDRAMGGKDYHFYRKNFAGDEARLALFKKVYKANKPSKVAACREPKIPKIIHHLWLGKKEISQKLQEMMSSFRKLNPDWEYHLWTDVRVRAFDFEQKEQFYSHGAFNLKADILRAEILDRFGGIVVDADFELLQPLDTLHAKYDFYTACITPQMGNESLLSSALIGAHPNHPIIKEWKKHLKAEESSAFEKAVAAKLLEPDLVNIVLPSSYFYPISEPHMTTWMKRRSSFVKNFFQSFFEFLHIKKTIPFTKTRPESMAVYYWGGNFLKTNEEYFTELYHDLLEQQQELSGEVKKLQNELQKMKGNNVLGSGNFSHEKK